MYIYYILFLLIISLYLILNNTKKYMFVITVILTLIIGLRGTTVGTDTQNYLWMYINQTKESVEYFFNTFPSLNIISSDSLYFLYCYILQLFGIGERGFLLITSAIVVGVNAHFIYRYSKNYLLSIFTFVTIGLIPMFMSALRQSLALAIIGLAIRFLVERKPVKYCIMVLIASGFHVTALIMLPAYVLIKMLSKIPPLVTTGLGILISFLVSNNLYKIIWNMELGPRFMVYLTGNVVKTNPLVITMHLGIVGSCFFIHQGLRKSKWFREDSIFIDLYIIGVGIMILSLSNTMISRFAQYYFIVLPIILANIIERLNCQKNKIFLMVTCICVEIIYFVLVMPNSTFNIAPYNFYWENKGY